MARQILDVDAAYRELFDPEQNELLQIGRVSDQYQATPDEMAAARRKLAERQATWHWRLFEADDAILELLESEVAILVTKARGFQPEESPDAAEERFKPSIQEFIEITQAISEGRAAWKPLPFYGHDARLIHIDAGDALPSAAKRFVFARGDTRSVELDGDSTPIHEFNELLNIALDGSSVEEYLRFFCEHVHGDEGPFFLVEQDRPQEQDFPGCLEVTACDPREGSSLRDRLVDLDKGEPTRSDINAKRFPKATIGWPLTRIAWEGSPPLWMMLGTVIYGEGVYRVALRVEPNGVVEMVDDQPVAEAELTPVKPAWPVRSADGDGAPRKPAG